MTVLRNVLALLFADSVSGWRRDFGSFAPALASMTLVLALGGVVGVLAFTATTAFDGQIADASVVHAYLADQDQGNIDALVARLKADPRVRSVTYVSKEEALKRAQAHGLADLASATDSNPFPASLDIRVRGISDLAAVDRLVRSEATLDPQLKTSYDAGAYARINDLVLAIAVGAVTLLGLLAVVGVGITGASVRGVVLARRDELRALDLMGAPGWTLRGPFVTQGALTGLVAGILAAVIVLGIYSAEAQAVGAAVPRWLPAVATETSLAAACLLALAGVLLGGVASLTELRRA
jgi:cell division transport system permease protein